MNTDLVQAVVLAGGFGTRLYPLTCDKPKPLITVLDKSVVVSVIESIQRAGIKNIAVSTHFKHKMMQNACRELYGNIVCIREAVSLGTAGGVKNCYDEISENILVVSGDAVFDFDLSELLNYHVNNKNDVTILTTRKENPTELGSILCNDDARIKEIIEKPSWKSVKTDLVNTGIYVLSKSVMDEIPQNIKYDFSKDLFPKLLKNGKRVYSFTCSGYWCDVGTLDEYFDCNIACMKNKVKCISNDGLTPDELSKRGVFCENEIYASPSCSIGKNVKISCAVLCQSTRVADSCDISNSILCKGASIGQGSSVAGAIIGENVNVGQNCIIPEGCVIGDNTRISDGSILKKHSRIKSDSAFSGDGSMAGLFSKKSELFVDDGVAVFDINSCVSSLCDFGKALSAAYKKRQSMPVSALIMSNENCVFAMSALASGIMSSAGQVICCESGEISILKYICSAVKCDVGVYLYTKNDMLHAVVLGGDARALLTEDERKISRIYSSIRDEGDEKISIVLPPRAMHIPSNELYRAYLNNLSQRLLGACDISGIQVFTQNEKLKTLFACLGASVMPSSSQYTINAEVDNDRAKLRATTTIVDHDHACAVILKNLDVLSNPCVVLSENAPTVLKNMLPSEEQNNSELQLDLSDPYVVIAAVVCIIAMTGKSMPELLQQIPTFAVFSDEYLADVNRAATMEKLLRLYNDSRYDDTNGVRLSLADGNVTIIPNRAKGFKIISEAVNTEAAKELSFKIGQAIKNS